MGERRKPKENKRYVEPKSTILPLKNTLDRIKMKNESENLQLSKFRS